VDWPNLIEEVEDVGLSALKSVRSYIRQAMFNIIKVHAFRRSYSARKWGAEARNFLLEAQDRFTPSMRGKIDVDRLYNEAVGLASSEYPRLPPLPATSPYTLDDLLAEARDVDALAAKLDAAAAARDA
jgi:hypothetical protein